MACTWRMICSALAIYGGVLGCSDKQADVSTGEARGTGTLRMALTTELDGVSYGLQADVSITGPETLVIAAEPYQEFIERDLTPGAYTVGLEPGYQLFQLVPDDDPLPVESELLSPSSQAIEITSNETTQVLFRFAVEPVVEEPPPPPGTVEIGIEVERADAGAEAPPVLALSFATDVWPIFTANCTPCHSTIGSGGHFVGSPDVTIADADARRLGETLIDRLDGGGMPPACSGSPGDVGCISVADLATIQLWLDSGLAP